MGALYQMRYHGVAGDGHGTIAFANGKIAGVDMMGGRYIGAYAESGGELVGQVALTLPDGGSLVTGQQLAAGEQVPININLPPDLGGGRNVVVIVGGKPVEVALAKIGDL